MDANVNPDPKPNHNAEVTEVKSWLRQNTTSLIITALILWFVFFVLKLNFFDTFKVVFGLGFIIFIHELGHFLAAKWCDVHVRTFSIGFGPAIPFCSYKWGETTYMFGVIPLGGYVSMVGEGTGESLPDAEGDEEESDPRSFKNKSVWQRMVIISAGVIMNLIFGLSCFVAAYMHGVKEEPATVGATSSGGAAWRADLRTGDEIVQIGSRVNPTFKDLRPVVMSTDKGEKVPITVRRDGHEIKFEVEPIKDEGAFFPVLGVHGESRLTVYVPPKNAPDRLPVAHGSPAAKAGGFEPGDRLATMTDPANPAQLSPLKDLADYRRRMTLLASQAITLGVTRRGESDTAKPTEITVQPAYRSKFGLRMQIGKIAAIRAGSPAERAGIQAVSLDDGADGHGDRIAAVGLVDPSGKKTWLANGARPPEAKDGDAVRPFDPILLPRELLRWAAEHPETKRKDLKVELIVLRFGEPDHKEQRKSLVLDYDDRYRFEREMLPLPNSPLAADGLGLAYWVSSIVDEVEPGSPAAKAGIQPNDLVEAVQLDTAPKEPNWFQKLFGLTNEKWDEIKPHHWAFAESVLQSHTKEFKLKVKRGNDTVEVLLKGEEDKLWPIDERGLILQAESREQKAEGLGDAINLGARRTVRFIREVYMNLYSMIRGRVSVKTLSGPLTIADVSYKIAGEDFWQFLIFLGVISVNLAVVNFLPVPVLDGGHFVFLVYEKVTGRPLPERLFAALMYIGLAMIGTLFIFVISRDILRLYF